MHYSEGHDPIVPLRTIGKCTHLKTAIMATAKTVRTFLIPKTLDSRAILPDALAIVGVAVFPVPQVAAIYRSPHSPIFSSFVDEIGVNAINCIHLL